MGRTKPSRRKGKETKNKNKKTERLNATGDPLTWTEYPDWLEAYKQKTSDSGSREIMQ